MSVRISVRFMIVASFGVSKTKKPAQVALLFRIPQLKNPCRVKSSRSVMAKYLITANSEASTSKSETRCFSENIPVPKSRLTAKKYS